jgi:tyrosine-protein phosphatase YwqE
VVEFAERLCYIYDVAGNAPQLRNELLNEPERMLVEFYRRAVEQSGGSLFLEIEKMVITPSGVHAQRILQSILVKPDDIKRMAQAK